MQENQTTKSVEAQEREFHDDWAAGIDPHDVRVVETFTASTSPEPQWLLLQLGDIHGKRILELGSGAGESAVYFAMQGAQVVATDLSEGMLDVVQNVARLHGVEVEVQVCSAEDLSLFDDDSFDIVYAANLLHHVDIEVTLDEVKRVLKPGGQAAFWDPIAHNPLINVYRRMATKVRTEDEHPIRRRQRRYFTSRFSSVKTECFWLTTLLIFVKFYLINRIHPSEDRYWKRIIREESNLRSLYRPLAAIDRFLLRLFPILGWWCWNIAILVRK